VLDYESDDGERARQQEQQQEHCGYTPKTKIVSTVISAKRPKQPSASDTLVRP
jgi:hypothetical protein